MDNKYIILDSEKKPLHKFKNGGKTWDEVKDFDNIGQIVEEPYIVLDFDTSDDAQCVLNIIETVDLKCRIMRTTRGVHVWLKSKEPWKNFVKSKLAVGLLADCRSWGRAGYVKIRDGGKNREWIRYDEDVDDVPEWLYPVGLPSKSFNFKGMGAGDGRNQELFNYILFLQTKGLKKETIIQTIKLINRCVFAEPLPERELKTIIRDDAFKAEDEISKIVAENQAFKFDHSLMAQQIAEENNVICVNGTLYMYVDGYYKKAAYELERITLQLYPPIKTQQRSEVLAYLKLITYRDPEKIYTSPFIVNCENCRVDLRDNTTSQHTPDVIDFERVPVTYNPEAYCADVDKLLSSVFCGDAEVIELFTEILGDCLLRKNIYQRAFLFYGSGSNGKSTILRLIRRFIGSDNTSTISLEQLVGNYMGAELENRLINIGDDINYRPIKDSGTLKKLFSGEPLTVHRKYGQPFTLEPYATHLFSANEIPHNNDKSDGMTRRWCFVPFTARFSKDDPGYDPMIFEKVTTPEALSYLLNLALQGFKRLYARGYYIEPASVTEAMRTYQVENSSVLSWAEDEELELERVLTTPRDALFAEYRAYCANSGIREAVGVITFNKEMARAYNLDTKAKQNKIDHKRYFVIKI